MKQKIKFGANAIKAKQAIKGIIESIKDINISFDLEKKICNIEVKAK